MPTEIILPAYAKINLTLDVGARRPDGYHEIHSIMQTIALHDTLTVHRTPASPGVRLEVGGEEASGVPADESNLVHRAAVRLQKIAAARGQLVPDLSGLHIRLEKRIPSQAGLGGGSSDAASTVLALDQLFDLKLSLPRLQMIGAALGADVPFFLSGGTARIEGLGERVTPLPPLCPDWDLVIVKPPAGISTADAYGTLDALTGRVPGQATASWLAGTRALHNDFSAVMASVPQVARVFQALPDVPWMLCGSGSALFCRLEDARAGDALATRVRALGLGEAWVTRTIAGAA